MSVTSSVHPPLCPTAARPVAGGVWHVRELVTLGVFAAAAKVATLAVAMVGGGINPLTLMAKNCIFTTLVLVLLCKVRKPGTLALFMAVNFCVSLLLLGASVTLLLPLLVGAVLAEGAAWLVGGLARPWGPFVGVAVYDLTSKLTSVGLSWLVSRENPALLGMVVPIVAFGYLGALLGLFTGHRAVKELRRAGFAAC